MNEEKAQCHYVCWTDDQGTETEPLTKGERESFEELKQVAQEALGLSISGLAVTKKGYLGCWMRDGAKTTGTRVHRIIMAVYLGHRLESFDVVHHKNGNKRDNKISNLQVLAKAHHHKIHCLKKRLTVTTA